MFNETLSTVITRKREKDKTSNMFYNGQDITSLLVRDVDTLTIEKKIYLQKSYALYGCDFIEQIVVNNKIVPFAAHIFIDLDCDKDFWEKKHGFFVERNNKIKTLLDLVFSKMESNGCKSLTLTENFAAVLSSNSCIGCFCSGDVDLSADIIEKDLIITCLNSMNFFSKEQPDKIGEYSGQSMMFYNNVIIEGGFWINVIWKPVTRAFLIQDKYEARLSKDRLVARLIPNTKIRVLNETSLMYFCALHIAAGHYYTLTPGLRLYVDIDRLARGCKIVWDDIVKWAEEDAAGIRIATVMYLAYKLFETPIPPKVYKRVLKNKRNIRFINYLYTANTNQIQNTSSKLRRLYVELVSDDKNLVSSFINRFFKLLRLENR